MAVVSSLSVISKGRMIAGIGTGDHLSRPENEAFGVPFESAADAARPLVTVATAVRDLGIPVWVGGGLPRTIELARALGAAVNLWEGEPLRVAELAATGIEVTWGGPVGASAPEAAARLGELESAGATWAVCAWPDSLEPWPRRSSWPARRLTRARSGTARPDPDASRSSHGPRRPLDPGCPWARETSSNLGAWSSAGSTACRPTSSPPSTSCKDEARRHGPGRHRPGLRQPRPPLARRGRREAGRGGAQPAQPPLLGQPGHPEDPPGHHRPLPAQVRGRARPRHRGGHHHRRQGGPLPPDVGAGRPGRHRAGAVAVAIPSTSTPRCSPGPTCATSASTRPVPRPAGARARPSSAT